MTSRSGEWVFQAAKLDTMDTKLQLTCPSITGTLGGCGSHRVVLRARLIPNKSRERVIHHQDRNDSPCLYIWLSSSVDKEHNPERSSALVATYAATHINFAQDRPCSEQRGQHHPSSDSFTGSSSGHGSCRSHTCSPRVRPRASTLQKHPL